MTPDTNTVVSLPWFDPAGELNYSSMSFKTVGPLDRRLFFRLVRRFYKNKLGVSVCNGYLLNFWKSRVTCGLMDMERYLNERAMQSNEQAKEESDSCIQDDASQEAGR